MRSATTAPTPRDAIGVPFIPPGAATAGTTRVRGLLGRLHRRMAPPPVQVMEGLFGILDHRVLVALCEADVPDILTGPLHMDVLASRTGTDLDALDRLVRYGAARGWLRIDRRGRARPNHVTRFLRREHPGGWRAWVEFAAGEEVLNAVAELQPWHPPGSAFRAANGVDFFEWMAEHPDRWATFDRAMAAGGRTHSLTLSAAIDWSQSETVCDVGGGTGDLLAGLLSLQPELSGTVFDLPDVATRAVGHDRLTAVGGDAFKGVPTDFDTYLLVNVLHDWGNADATRILAQINSCMKPGARIIVVESERALIPADDMAVRSDVLMSALTPGGGERDRHQFADIAGTAGLRRERTVPLASGDVAHILRSRSPSPS